MFIENGPYRFLFLAVAGQFALLAAAPLLPAGETKIQELPTIMQKRSSTAAAREGVIGKAAYFSMHHKGKRTSSGERYDPLKLTAAHPTLPHGTRVKVLNMANNRSVVVTINDRCRKRSFEFIDLSRAAAQKLGFLHKGTASVRIIALEE